MAEGGRKNAPNLAKQFSLVIRSTIHYPAACRCVPDRAPVPRACAGAGMRFGTGAARGAGTLFSSTPAQSSGQAWANFPAK